jgi:ubiquinone/menaquinone biosynthesis C-methylase UbiE
MAQILEKGIPVGNWYDKYNTQNPIARYLVKNFFLVIGEILYSIQTDIVSITDLGCGEGDLTNYICNLNIVEKINACDSSSKVIGIAKKNSKSSKINFYLKDIYEIGEQEKADLIVCCEVLEHLKYPEKALNKIKQVTNKYCLLSVPCEPIWRVMNLCRGKYITKCGNTPGHINHWSSGSFADLVHIYFDIMTVRKVLPWTVVICKKKPE